MPWPFGSSGPSSSGQDDDDDGRDRDDQRKPASWLGIEPDWEHYKSAKNWLPTALVTIATISTLAFYRSYLRRIPSPAHIPAEMFRKRSLFGKVTSVGDGDNFHFFHTPGGRLAGWGWLRRVPSNKADLKGQTIPIRIAGIDAPEGAHFGRPAQPHAAEALTWLSDYLLGRRVRARIHKRDQYERVVATVLVRRPTWLPLLRRDVGLEMLRRGLATTYEAKSGAEFGGREAQYKAAEAKAKARKKGLWATKAALFESPRDYKNRMAAAEGVDKSGIP